MSFTAFLWSSSGLFIKILHINAFQISFYRSGIAAITVLIISLFRKSTTGGKIEFDKTTNIASVFYAGILIFFVMATKMTTAANAIFLQFTAPIYLLILEPIFFKDKIRKEKFNYNFHNYYWNDFVFLRQAGDWKYLWKSYRHCIRNLLRSVFIAPEKKKNSISHGKRVKQYYHR